jgi:hypothetical protein
VKKGSGNFVANARVLLFALPFSLQNLAERLGRLPGPFIADVGIANGCADILVSEQFLDFAQILSHVVEVSIEFVAERFVLVGIAVKGATGGKVRFQKRRGPPSPATVGRLRSSNCLFCVA